MYLKTHVVTPDGPQTTESLEQVLWKMRGRVLLTKQIFKPMLLQPLHGTFCDKKKLRTSQKNCAFPLTKMIVPRLGDA